MSEMHYRNQINLLIDPLGIEGPEIAKNTKTLNPWNNGKEVPRWGVAEIQKMSPGLVGHSVFAVQAWSNL